MKKILSILVLVVIFSNITTMLISAESLGELENLSKNKIPDIMLPNSVIEYD